MNIFQKLTVKQLIKNRTRTLVTIVGIVLSASMICAVTTFASSLQRMLLNRAIDEYGDYYGSSENVPAEIAGKMETDKRISRIVEGQELGYAFLEKGVNEYKPYLYLLGVDDEFAKVMSVHLISGRLPQAQGEILIPQHVALNGGVQFELGQVITLAVGRRTGIDGEQLFQQTALQCDEKEQSLETIEDSREMSFTVVGFYERPGFEPYIAPGYTALTVKSGENAGSHYSVYFKTKNPERLMEVQEDYELQLKKNTSVLRFSGVLGDTEFGQMIYGFAMVVIGIIMFGSIALIYNAFAISVSERTRQYGLLSSLGATRRQLKKSVLFEAAVVGVIGVPVGIAAGIAGIGVTLYLLRDKLQEMFGLAVELKLYVSWLSVVAAVLVSAVTILLSAWIPAKRATRITPMEAIRQSSDIRIRPGEVRVSPLVSRLFKVEGMIGAKYFRRDRKRYRATILSLMMSVFLFISASALIMYLTDSVEGRMAGQGDFDLSVSAYDDAWELDRMESEKARMEQVTGVEKVGYFLSGSTDQMAITPEIVSEEYIRYIEQAGGTNFDVLQSPDEIEVSGIGVYFLSEQEYLEYAKQQGIDVEKLLTGEVPLAIGYSKRTGYLESTKQYVRYQILKEASPENPVEVEKLEWQWREQDDDGKYVPAGKLYVGMNADELPFCLSADWPVMLIYPISVYEKLETMPEDSYVLVNYRIVSSDHRATKEALDKRNTEGYNIYDYAADIEEDRSMVTVVNVFAYGFILLISLIAVTNVFNTISTNVALRSREFAVLKSMGMDNRGLQRMMNYECVLYGMRSLAMGLPLSIAMTWLIFRVTNIGYQSEFYLPWRAIGFAVFCVFFVVFVSMLYAMNKIRHENPIDALKSELA